jgi:hypothetical protein
MSTTPATFIGTLTLVPTGNGFYGVNPVTAYGDCLNIPAAGDVIVEALASRLGATASVTGFTLSAQLSACP